MTDTPPPPPEDQDTSRPGSITDRQLAAFLEQLPLPVFVKNSRRRFVYANAAARRVAGCDQPSLLGRRSEALLPRLAPEDHARIREADLAVLADDTTIENDFPLHGLPEMRTVRTLVRDTATDRDFILGVSRDMSQERAAEARLSASLAEKDLLLREVHHRVKNNLQIVSSLLSLASDAVTDPEALEPFNQSIDRIMTLALVHEELFQSADLSGIDAAAYAAKIVDRLIAAYRSDGGVRLELDCQPVPLSMDAAIPFGLIVNELATNAVKHGLPGRQPGTVAFSLTADDDLVRLQIADNGVGLPPDLDVRATASLGMRLVVSLVGQLRGTLTILRENGTRFVIEFPRR